MTVSATNAFSGPYSGNGVTTAFPFTFEATDTAEVAVDVDGAVQSSGVTVTLNAGGNGGTATFAVAPATGTVVIPFLDPDFTQDISFTNAGRFLPATHTEGFDRAAIRAIYLKGLLDRAVLAPLGSNGLTVTAADEGGVVGVGADGALEVLGPGAFIGATGAIEISGVAWVTPQMFGAVADGVTDDGAAFVAAIAYLKSIGVANGPYNKGSPKLFIPAGTYWLNTTTLDISHTLIIEGEASWLEVGSKLRWADGVTAIRLQAHNTSGAGTVDPSPFHFSAGGTIIRNLALIGPVEDTGANFTGVEAEQHGIHAKTSFIIEDVIINGFRGDGVHCLASAGAGDASEGNLNTAQINRLRVTSVRNGVYLDGADSNACTLIGVVGTYCRQHTVWDSSFLGNTHIGHHSANAGLVPGVAASVVHKSGRWFMVKQGQAVGASTNSPPATATDNTWWAYLSAGAENLALNVPTWVNGISVREGGSYRTDSANAVNLFIGCYIEGGEATAQFTSPTEVIGGLYGSRAPLRTGGADGLGGNYYAGDQLDAPNPAKLGKTRVRYTSGGGADKILTVHNDSAIASTVKSRMSLAQGADAAGDPCSLVELVAYGNTADAATTEGHFGFAVRAAGVMVERILYSDAARVWYPVTDNNIDIGGGANRWKGVFAYTGDFTTQVKVNGVKVLGAQGAALPADATDLATALTLVNAMKARLAAHGLVA